MFPNDALLELAVVLSALDDGLEEARRLARLSPDFIVLPSLVEKIEEEAQAQIDRWPLTGAALGQRRTVV